jgi:Brp/Blh family beta-carotene 15,15'-monooxygenase
LYGEIIYSNFLNQLYIFLIPLIWPGLAHGSLDILTAKRKKLIKDPFSFFYFLILYLFIPIFFFLIWQIYPNHIFTIFLVLSLMHFGISDKLNNKKSLVINEILLRSLIIICLPIIFYNEQTLAVFYFLNISNEYGIFLTKFFSFASYLIIPLILVFFFTTLKNQEYGHLIDITILFFCFIFFQPLLSFFIYFCFLHSVRHLLNEKKILNLSNKSLLLKTIPMTLIVLFSFFCLIFLFFYFPKLINFLNLNNLIIAVFCLTISHVVLINFIKDK